MANFPSSITPAWTSKTDNVDYPQANDVNLPNQEVVAIETTLGTNPQGGSSTVKDRLNAVDASITALGYVDDAITCVANAATIPVTYRYHTITNNSAAAMTLTLTTAGAVKDQLQLLRILDASAVAQTINWVNTENSSVSIPTSSNGSTTLPLTVGLQFNDLTTKWRCVGYA